MRKDIPHCTLMRTPLLVQSVLVLTCSAGVRINVIIICFDNNIAFLRTRLPWAHTVLSTFGWANLFLLVVVYPPFDTPHMLACRGTCHDRTLTGDFVKESQGLLVWHQSENNLPDCLICVLEHSLVPGNGIKFNMTYYIGLNTNRGRVTESVFVETINSMGRAHKSLHPRQLLLYDWKSDFAGTIHCAGKDIFLAQCAHLYICESAVLNHFAVKAFCTLWNN